MDINATLKLNELILAAGGQTKLASLLGVEQRAISDWKRAGQISKIGALLVTRSRLLKSLFDAQELRPDLEPKEIKSLRDHQWYVEARIRQIEYENNPEFAQSSLFYISSRLGLNEAENE